MEKLEHFQHILLFEFSRGAKAEEVARNICPVYGDNAFGKSKARNCFSHFKEDRFDISNAPRSGILSGLDVDRFNTVIHNDQRHCSR